MNAAGVVALLPAVAALLQACGDSSDHTTYTNPGHAPTAAVLTAGEISVAVAVAGNYTLLAGAHSHTFTLAAGDFTSLQAGGTVSKTRQRRSRAYAHDRLLSRRSELRIVFFADHDRTAGASA